MLCGRPTKLLSSPVVAQFVTPHRSQTTRDEAKSLVKVGFINNRCRRVLHKS